MIVPEDLKADVLQFVQDFDLVTKRWVRDGWHTAAEVAEWRLVIRRDMGTVCGADPAIDHRPQDERIKAWCRLFREIVVKERMC